MLLHQRDWSALPTGVDVLGSAALSDAFNDFLEFDENDQEDQDEDDLGVSVDEPRVQTLALALARAFVSGAFDAGSLRHRGALVLGLEPSAPTSPQYRWLTVLALRIHYAFKDLLAGSAQIPAIAQEIARELVAQKVFANEDSQSLHIRGYFFPPAAPKGLGLRPLRAFIHNVPALSTVGDLADWLDMSSQHLDWFANWQNRAIPQTNSPLSHYRYRWVRKHSGSLPRLIEAPKNRLKQIQRKILNEILSVLPLHNAAHGAIRGRSALSHARLHEAPSALLKFDIKDFYPCVPIGRVFAIFAALGYSRMLCRYFTALVTSITPQQVLGVTALNVVMPMPTEPVGGDVLSAYHYQDAVRQWRHNRQRLAHLYGQRHLPQGAPTSAFLANLASSRLDMRLAAAAQSVGGRYSRYVDDLAISLPNMSRAQAGRIQSMALHIIREEGFVPNLRKTGIYFPSQGQYLAGVVVNQHPNVSRKEFDALKAILHNCVRHGPVSQNRTQHPQFKAHLQGRIAWCHRINPQRGSQLQALFSQIVWDA